MRIAKKHHDGCSQCGAAANFDTRPCTEKHCHKLFCARCASHCTECGDVVCAEHLRVVSGESYCPGCGDQQYEHYQQMFDLLRSLVLKGEDCPDCGGALEDDSDPFGDRDVEERYACYSCGLSATKRRMPSEALRLAQSLRYSGGGPALPEPDYIVVEGSRPARKPAVAAQAVNQEVAL